MPDQRWLLTQNLSTRLGYGSLARVLRPLHPLPPALQGSCLSRSVGFSLAEYRLYYSVRVLVVTSPLAQ